MTHPHWSSTTIAIILAAVAILFYAAIVLYGAWVDGKRQEVRDEGRHPVTSAGGRVEAREDEHDD